MIAIIGLGTLGSRVAHKLKEHNLHIYDFDTVTQENLQTQEYTPKDVDTQKVYAIMRRIPTVRAHNTFIDQTNIELLSQAEIIIDCTDNLTTRKILGNYCYNQGIPLIHAAAGTTRGILGCFIGKHCLNCIYHNKISVENCRGRDIDTALAEHIACEQARIAKEILRGEEQHSLTLITAENITEITMKPCETCIEEIHEKYYITWCTRTNKLSAKPLHTQTFTQTTETVHGHQIELEPNGEIQFLDEIEIDEAKEIAHHVYSREAL